MKKTTYLSIEEIFQIFMKNKRVIDIGAGLGGDPWKFRLIQKYANYALAVDNWMPKNIKLIADINFIKSKIEDLDLDDKFDIVFSSEVIEHMPNQIDFLKKLKTLLTDDGKIIITTPNSTWIHNFIYILLNNKDPREDKIFKQIDGVFVSGHPLIHNISTLQQLFYIAGLKVDKVFYSNPYKNKQGIKNRLKSFIYEFRPNLSETILVVGSKL